MAARVYSFKSVGETPSAVSQRKSQLVTSPPIGIKTPLELGSDSDGLLKMHRDLGDQVSDNLRNLLLTNKGERLMDYEFGANLSELTFELGSEDADTEAMTRIKSAVSRYMPYISLETLKSIRETADDDLARVGVRITYTVPAFSEKTRVVEVILYSGG